MITCRCREIQAADPLRHFTGCPLREPLPEGHPAAGSCVKPDPFADEIAAEADRIDSGWSIPFAVGMARHAVDELQAGTAHGRHERLVWLAACALVALRAEAREAAAAKGGGA